MEDDVHLGNDDATPVAVMRLPDGRALLLPRSLSKHRGRTLEVVADCQHLVAELQRLQGDLREIVDDLRSLGVSWDGIGWCVGTTGEAARQRWGFAPGE